VRVKRIQIDLEYDIKSTVPCERQGTKIVTIKLLSPIEIGCEWDDTQGVAAAVSAILKKQGEEFK
jgi:hypothetical protein